MVFRRKKGKSLDGFIRWHNAKFVGSSESNNGIGLQNKGGSFVKKDGAEDYEDTSIGKELDLIIIAKGAEGDGIAKYKGHTVIVPETKINDKVKVVVTNISKGTIFGKVKPKNEQG